MGSHRGDSYAQVDHFVDVIAYFKPIILNPLFDNDRSSTLPTDKSPIKNVCGELYHYASSSQLKYSTLMKILSSCYKLIHSLVFTAHIRHLAPCPVFRRLVFALYRILYASLYVLSSNAYKHSMELLRAF